MLVKINSTGYTHYIDKSYGENKKNIEIYASDDETSSDRVEISNASKEIKSYFDQPRDTAIETQRVSTIKSAIQAGTYKVSSDELAQQIVSKINEQA